jgi:hypothetical protein
VEQEALQTATVVAAALTLVEELADTHTKQLPAGVVVVLELL